MKNEVVQFGKHQHLKGILSIPDKQLSDHCFILLNPGILSRIGQYRVYVKIAQALAKLGFCCFRFDLSGNGDSEFIDDDNKLDHQNRVAHEVSLAIEYLQNRNLCKKVILGGICSGAANALYTAYQNSQYISGLVLINQGFRESRRGYWRTRLLDVTRWKNKFKKIILLRNNNRPTKNTNAMDAAAKDIVFDYKAIGAEEYQKIINNKVKILMLCSQWDGYLDAGYDILKKLAKNNVRGDVVGDVIPDADHNLTYLKNQEFVIKEISQWAQNKFMGKNEQYSEMPLPYKNFSFARNMLPR